MPSALWSAPSSPTLGAASGTVSSFTASTLADVSPYQCLIPAGMLNLGTRVRILAQGSYQSSSSSLTLQWGFYMAATSTAIGSGVVLGLTGAVTTAAVTGIPWILQYFGHIAAVSVNGSNTTGSVVGRGFLTYGTTLTAISLSPMPQTLALVTVAQSTAQMRTTDEQNVMVGVTPGSSVSGLTNVITDELTCELIG